MESPAPASPPSRRHRRPGRPAAGLQRVPPLQQSGLPDLTTAFHGLLQAPSVVHKGEGRSRAAVDADEGAGKANPVSKEGGAVRELKLRPQERLPVASKSTAPVEEEEWAFCAALEGLKKRPRRQRDELSPSPRPRAPRPTRQQQEEGVKNSLQSLSPSLPDGHARQPVLVRPATGTRTHWHGKPPDPTWAACVLTSIRLQQVACGEFGSKNSERLKGAKADRTKVDNFDAETSLEAPSSTDEFLLDVLPKSTRKESNRHTFLGGGVWRGKGKKRERLDLSSEDEKQDDLRKSQSRRPRGRVPHCLHADVLHDSGTSEEKTLFKAPYRTSSTDTRTLPLGPPSQTAVNHNGAPGLIRNCKRQCAKAEAKVKRLEPGRSPRTPFLHSIAQTSFMPSVTPGLKRITSTVGLERKSGGPSKGGSGPTKKLKKEVPLSRPDGGRSEPLTMVDEDDAGYVYKIASTFRREPPARIKKIKPALKIRSKSPTDRFRFIPARLPPPLRPFVIKPRPVGVVPPPEARRFLPKVGPAVQASKASPAAKQTKFRFITGPKAKRAPTVDAGWWQPGQEKPVKPSNTPRLLRRLSTRPDFQLASSPAPESKLPYILEEAQPEDDRHTSSHSRGGTSSSSSSARSRLPRRPNDLVLPDSGDVSPFSLAAFPPPAQLAQPADVLSPASQRRPSQLDDSFADTSSSFERHAPAVAETEDLLFGDFIIHERKLGHGQRAKDSLDQPSPPASGCCTLAASPRTPPPGSAPRGGWWTRVPTLSAVAGQAESPEVNLALHRAGGRARPCSRPGTAWGFSFSFGEDADAGAGEQHKVPLSAGLVEEEEEGGWTP